MSYIELQYYRSHALEVREYGDTGWAVHVYPPREVQGRVPITIVQTVVASNLNRLLSEARTAIDTALSAGHIVTPDAVSER